MSVNFQELRELLLAIAQTDITELTLKSDEFELMVKKASVVSNPELPPSVPAVVTTSVPPVPVPPSVATTNNTPLVEPTPPPNLEQQKWLEITSPMVGTFYRAPAPDEPSFVDVGDRIAKGDTVCIIEAMKLMNDIEAEISGEIVEIVVQNGEPVEFGQVLMRVNPS